MKLPWIYVKTRPWIRICMKWMHIRNPGAVDLFSEEFVLFLCIKTTVEHLLQVSPIVLADSSKLLFRMSLWSIIFVLDFFFLS